VIAPRPIAQSRTDSDGSFAIDLSTAAADVPDPGVFKEGQSKNHIETIHERPSPDSLFLTATGGSTGAGFNSAIKFSLTLGDVTGLRAVKINELTTVLTAFIYAHAMTEIPGPMISGKSIVRALVDPERGTLRPIFNEGANTPAMINTLANIVAACVRSNGPQSQACSALFAAAPTIIAPGRPYSRTQTPADTLEALNNIALSPIHNVRQLYALTPSNPVYTPFLTSQPRAFTIALNFTEGGLRHPAGIAFDSVSNAIWIANEGGNSVIELGAAADNLGRPLSPPRGFTGGGLSAPIAIKFVEIPPQKSSSSEPARPSLWVANKAGDSLTEILLPKPGKAGPPTLRRISGNGLNAPVDLLETGAGIFSDSRGESFSNQVIAVANSGSNEVSLFKPISGLPCGPPIRVEGLKRATGIGIGINGIWVADTAADALFAIEPPDYSCKGAGVLGKIAAAHLIAPQFITQEMQSGATSVTNAGSKSVAVFSHSDIGGPHPAFLPRELAGSPFTGGGLDGPAGIVIDGDSNAWVANNAPGANSISEIGHVTDIFGNTVGTGLPLSPAVGFNGPGLDRPFAIAIDKSGSVWVTNRGGNSVTVFLGAAIAPL
jgi:DNA-binding beta-propeller fold protein YncE